MRKILIVDDDIIMREALRAIIQDDSTEVTEAANGKLAQALLEKQNFDLIISDIQMPEMTGVDLLTWVKANKKIPMILITGFSHILETKTAYELGASGFLTKPFSSEQIKKAISDIFDGTKKTDENKSIENNFLQIPLEDFVSSTSLQINIYIRLSDTKFVLVAHKGDPISVGRVETYKAKGLAYMYAKKDDYSHLVGFNLNMTGLDLKPLEETKEKTQFLRYSIDLLVDKTLITGIDTAAFKRAADCVQICVATVIESKPIFDLLNLINKHAGFIYAHSLGVSIYSVMIARKMGWTSQATLFKLATAGLFHDIGEKEINPQLLAKDRSSITYDEKRSLESHPTRSVEILQSMELFSDEIIQIIMQHHESCTGRGYPHQLSRNKIHPLAKVVATADLFCNLAIPSPRSKGCNAFDAVQLIHSNYAEEIDKPALAALKSICILENDEKPKFKSPI